MTLEYITRATARRTGRASGERSGRRFRRLGSGSAPVSGAALVLVALTALGGCSVGREALNAQLPALEDSVDRSLAEDELADAERVARDLEDRLPGVDTYSLLGRVLWRTGHLLDAEALHRRAAPVGLPEALLGLARAQVARGELEAAADRLEPLLEAPVVAARAARLQAAIELAVGDREAAVRLLAGAADDPDNPRAARDAAEADALAALTGAYGQWTGEPGTLRVTAGGLVQATLDGRRVRAQLSLLEARSLLSSRLAADDAPEAEDAAVPTARAARIGLGLMESEGVLGVAELPEGVDLRIGFDLLSRLHWSLELATGTLSIAPAGADLERPLELPRTHWSTARVVRDGLAVELLVFPRVAGRVQSAGLDLDDGTRLDRRVAEAAEVAPDRGTIEVELRLGAWRGLFEARIVDLYPLGADGAVAPRAVLGRELLEGWRIVWIPGRTELALERVE